MHSDQTRKYGISESIIQDIVGNNKGLYYGFRDAILSRLVTMHQAPGASCGILVLSLVLFMQSLYTRSNL